MTTMTRPGPPRVPHRQASFAVVTTAPADAERLERMLDLLGASISDVRTITINGEPRSKARPRFSGNGHVYSDEKQRAHHQIMALFLNQAFHQPLDGNVAVACLFVRSSKGRVDIDNMTKQVLDVATKICWHDDYQVTALAAITELDHEQPRTVISFAPHVSSMDRSPQDIPATCRRCGASFTWRAYRSQAHLRRGQFCSLACMRAISQLGRRSKATCLRCHETFVRAAAGQTYCTDACRMAVLIERTRARRKHPTATCRTCGVKVSRPEYQRCRKCWASDEAAP